MLLARIAGALTKHLMDAFNVQIPPCIGFWILPWLRMRQHGNAFRSALRGRYRCRQRIFNLIRITVFSDIAGVSYFPYLLGSLLRFIK
jgi:hypothetical protein